MDKVLSSLRQPLYPGSELMATAAGGSCRDQPLARGGRGPVSLFSAPAGDLPRCPHLHPTACCGPGQLVAGGPRGSGRTRRSLTPASLLETTEQSSPEHFEISGKQQCEISIPKTSEALSYIGGTRPSLRPQLSNLTF